MAVSIDTVYQRVLVLANKEQRGYITPQEFNLLANHAQMEIFEQYFYDIDQFNRMPGNTQEFSDMLGVLYEKVGPFEVERDNSWMAANMPIVSGEWMSVPWDIMYKLGTIRLGGNQCEMLNSKDFDLARQSPLTSPTLSRPIAYLTEQGIAIYTSATQFITWSNAQSIHGVGLNMGYTARPKKVQWAYVVINDKPLYNDNISDDFQLHSSEETKLVYKILKLAGVNLRAQEVVQVADALEKAQHEQQK